MSDSENSVINSNDENDNYYKNPLFEFNYSVRFPYKQAKKFVKKCKGFCYDDFDPDLMDKYELDYIRTVKDFFDCCQHFIGKVNINVCPKNFDCIVEGKVSVYDYGEFDESYELWRNIAEYTRNFQFIVKYPDSSILDDEVCAENNIMNIVKVIFRNKNGEISFYNVDHKDRVKEESSDEFIDMDPATIKENYCHKGPRKDYSKSMSENEYKKVFKYLQKLYGIIEEDDEEIEILDKLNIK
jgi:hypothetical protein